MKHAPVGLIFLAQNGDEILNVKTDAQKKLKGKDWLENETLPANPRKTPRLGRQHFSGALGNLLSLGAAHFRRGYGCGFEVMKGI